MDLGYQTDAAKKYDSFGTKSFVGDTVLMGALNALALTGTTVLDFGCGNGRMAPVLLERGVAHVEGIDPSTAMIENAQKLTSTLSACDGAKLHFSRSEGASLPFADASFDAIIAHFVFHYLPDPLTTANELHRVLKPAGAFIATFNYFSFTQEGAKLKNQIVPILIGEKVRADIYARGKDTLIGSIESAGFRILKTEPFDSRSAYVAPDFPGRDQMQFQNVMVVATK
ncbi:MAG TPA: class I SAM-dependent methyltransferase [Candidatus Paceibacterota bacterium]